MHQRNTHTHRYHSGQLAMRGAARGCTKNNKYSTLHILYRLRMLPGTSDGEYLPAA